MNLTLCSLFTSNLAASPLLMFPSTHDTTSSLNFNYLSTRYFFSSFLFTHTNTIKASISRSSFINYIRTPLIFKNAEVNKCYYTLDNLKEKEFKNCQFEHKGSTESVVIVIEKCTFAECHVETKGGSIYFQNDGSLTVHGTIFKDTSASDGGAIFAAKKEGSSGSSMTHEDAKIFHSHYCCYSSCSTTGYGSAALIAASNIQLNFSSTLKCPGDGQATGAQFDLKANDNSPFIASSNINSTTGKSKFCASLEYRHASSGFFRFQTIVDHFGGFITSFTDLKENVDISHCNILNVTLHGGLDNGAVPGVIHVRTNGVKVSNFYFYFIDFNGMSHESARLISYEKGQTITAELIDSYVEVDESYIKNYCTTQNVRLIKPNSGAEIETQPITQLDLGDCKGEVQKSPPPIDYEEPDPTSEIIETSEPTSEFIETSDPTSEFIETSEPTSEFIKTSEPTSEFIETSEPTSEFIETSEPTSEIIVTPDISESISASDFIPVFDKDVDLGGGSKGGNKGAMIGIIVGCVAAAAVIAGLVAFFVIRKRKSLNLADDISGVEDQQSAVTTDNSLRHMMTNDDPFQNEFENKDSTEI